MTFIPSVGNKMAKGTGGTNSAKYCYSVWLRHMVIAKGSGLNTSPKVIVELGPGDSLGIGLAGLISGCEKYFALDAVVHASSARNKATFDELVLLFQNRTPIPGDDEFPNIRPKLVCYDFPADVLDEERMHFALSPSRLEGIRESLNSTNTSTSMISYMAPWDNMDLIERQSVDLIYSQAVLEHIDDLKSVYGNMYAWLKPNGYLSHQIDYKCHGTADEWNGHWTYSDLVWSLIRGNRSYLINREPHSTHIRIMQSEHFDVVCEIIFESESRIKINQLASRFKTMSSNDLVISGAFVQAVKRVD